MAILRAQCSFGADLPDARHRFIITPHFNVTWEPIAGGPDVQGFCDDLSTALSTWVTNNREVTVTAYNAETAPPSYPLATKTRNLGLFPASGVCRELAVCLSYKAGNGPSRRGRLYVPVVLSGFNSIGVRPSSSQMNFSAALAPILRGAGGVNVQWGVWSRKLSDFEPTDTAYVDDEWDIIRSRGLPKTSVVTAGSGS